MTSTYNIKLLIINFIFIYLFDIHNLMKPRFENLVKWKFELEIFQQTINNNLIVHVQKNYWLWNFILKFLVFFFFCGFTNEFSIIIFFSYFYNFLRIEFFNFFRCKQIRQWILCLKNTMNPLKLNNKDINFKLKYQILGNLQNL